MTGQQTRPVRAFTLVELLVVVGIIAVLISILIPSLSRAREQARTTVCGTKIRGWGLGLLLYASDFSDRLPLDGGDGTSAQPIGVWNDPGLWFNGVTVYMGTGNRSYDQVQVDAINNGNQFLLPKGGTNSFFVCPSATDAWNDPDPAYNAGDTIANGYYMTTGYFAITKSGPGGTPVRPMFLCYGMNSQLRTKDYGNWQTYYAPDNTPGDCVSLNRLKPAALIPLVAEKRVRQDELQKSPVPDPNYTKALTQSKVTANRFTARHKKGGNIVMADGHVEWLENRKMNTGPGANKLNAYNYPGLVIWNPSFPH